MRSREEVPARGPAPRAALRRPPSGLPRLPPLVADWLGFALTRS